MHEEQKLASKTHVLMTSPSLLLSHLGMTLYTQRCQQRGFCYKYRMRRWGSPWVVAKSTSQHPVVHRQPSMTGNGVP